MDCTNDSSSDSYDSNDDDDDDNPANRTIFIRDLPTHITHGEIINVFSTVGPIEVSL
jgi:RNA recognition motif-containing protein